MPSEKTKKLLEGLGKITASKENPVPLHNTRVFLPETNRMWKSVIDLYAFPKSYNKAKWNKVSDGDGEVDYWTPYDRVYGGLTGQSLIQKNGTEYLGKLHRKRRLITGKDSATGEKNNFYSPCISTADGRWFDNMGMPIEAPANLEPEKTKTAEEIEEENRIKAERSKAKEATILANLK